MELRDGLAKFRVDLRGKEIDLLFERFDKDSSGNMEYREFLDLIGTDLKATNSRAAQVKADTDSIMEMIRRKMDD